MRFLFCLCGVGVLLPDVVACRLSSGSREIES
nr:MAG TPA: hypothetical protein [Caudoviricetes sp.]